MDSRAYDIMQAIPLASLVSSEESLADIASSAQSPGGASGAFGTLIGLQPHQLTDTAMSGSLADRKAALNALVSELYSRGFGNEYNFFAHHSSKKVF